MTAPVSGLTVCARRRLVRLVRLVRDHHNSVILRGRILFALLAAVARVKEPCYDADLAGFLAAFGADAFTEYVGEAKMISRDTATYRTVAYAVQQGNPPQLRLILIMTGTVRFTGPNNITVSLVTEVYAAATDADGDGCPDEGATPLFTSLPEVTHGRRVPNQ